MSKVFLLGDGAQAKLLQRLRCRDEGAELQDLLEQNPHLLPSEQIYPDDPPQWLLVKREMPVIDPGTGNERWSIDFLFVDHMAVPTLVECKRCDDTRARREVIAQMLEYAANGHHYWSSEDLQARAQESVGGLEQLNGWVSRSYAGGGGTSEFFEAVIANLRKATMRLVFFLEESPYELRSLVEFLNGQLKETEVLLVEARLYDSPAGRVVVTAAHVLHQYESDLKNGPFRLQLMVSIRSAPSGVLMGNDENKCPLMDRRTLNLERDLACR